jgi:hypothetical protein
LQHRYTTMNHHNSFSSRSTMPLYHFRNTNSDGYVWRTMFNAKKIEQSYHRRYGNASCCSCTKKRHKFRC